MFEGREGTKRPAGCPKSAGKPKCFWKHWTRAHVRSQTTDCFTTVNNCSVGGELDSDKMETKYDIEARTRDHVRR